MKILLKILLVMMIIFGLLAAGAYIFLKDLDLNKYKDRITTQLSTRLGRQVRAGDINASFSLSQGLVLSVDEIGVADDPAFSQEEIFSAQRVFLDADIMALVQQRKLSVKKVELANPILRLVRDVRGETNLQALISAVGSQKTGEAQEDEDLAGQDARSKPSGSSSGAGRALAVSVEEALLKDGQIILTDRVKSRPSVFVLNGVDVTLKDVALNKEFSFELDLGVFSRKDNVRVGGQCLVDTKSTLVILDGLELDVDLSKISMERLNEFNPQIASKFKTGLRGKITLRDGELTLGAGGLQSLALDVRLSEGRLALMDVPFDLEDIKGDVFVRRDVIKLSDFAVQLAEGSVMLKGEIKDYLTAPQYRLHLVTKDLQLEELTALQDSEVKVAGALQTALDISGVGLNPEDALGSLQLKGGMDVENGRLKDLNVLRIIFSKMSMVPNLVAKIEESLPEKYKDELKRNDTLFKTMSIDLDSQGSDIVMDRMELAAEAFAFLANGRVDLAGNMIMDGQVMIPADLSASMVKAVEELQGIVNAEGELFIPLKRYEGPAESYRPQPDLAYLSKRLIVNRGRQELDKVLDKVFGGDEEDQPQGEQPQTQDGSTQQPPQEEEKPIERQVIEGVLDAIFQ